MIAFEGVQDSPLVVAVGTAFVVSVPVQGFQLGETVCAEGRDGSSAPHGLVVKPVGDGVIGQRNIFRGPEAGGQFN